MENSMGCVWTRLDVLLYNQPNPHPRSPVSGVALTGMTHQRMANSREPGAHVRRVTPDGYGGYERLGPLLVWLAVRERLVYT